MEILGYFYLFLDRGISKSHLLMSAGGPLCGVCSGHGTDLLLHHGCIKRVYGLKGSVGDSGVSAGGGA